MSSNAETPSSPPLNDAERPALQAIRSAQGGYEETGSLAEGRRDMEDAHNQSYIDTTSVATPDETKILDRVNGTAKATLYATTFAFFLGLSLATLYSPVMNDMNKFLGFSDVQKAFVNSSPNLSGALLRLPAGIALEKYSTKKVHAVLMSMCVIGILPMVFISIFMYEEQFSSSLFLPMLFMGWMCGGGIATFSPGIATASFWFPMKDQGMALAIYGGLGNLSPALWNIFVPNLTNLLGLGGMYMCWMVWLAWSAYLAWLYMDDNPYTQLRRTHLKLQEEHPTWNLPPFDSDRAKTLSHTRWQQEKFPAATGSAFDALIGAIKIVPVVLLVITYMVSFGGFLALVAYLPTYWLEGFGFGTVKAGLCTFVYAMITALIRVPGGKLSDRFGGLKVGYVSIIIMGVASILLMVADNFPLAMTSVILMGSGMGLLNGATFKVVPTVCGSYLTGASAWIGSLGASSGFFIPVIMAEIASGYDESDSGHYRMPWVVYVGCSALTLVLWFLVGFYTKKKDDPKKSDDSKPSDENIATRSQVGLTSPGGAETHSEIGMTHVVMSASPPVETVPVRIP